MEVKLFEIRDSATFIPVMATRLLSRSDAELFLLRRSGYGREQVLDGVEPAYVILCKLDGVEANYDVFSWGRARTMGTAHQYIIDNWDDLTSGDVIDVEFITGEAKEAKLSERVTVGNYD